MRLMAAHPNDPAAQAQAAVLQIYCRPASDDEAMALSAFAREHGVAALCRVLFNSNEFLYAP